MTGAVFGGPAGGVSAGSSADLHGTLLGMPHLADVQPVERNAIGVVYSATDLKLERRVTVRVLNPMNGEAARIRFDHECKLLGRLSAHPNVITLYDAGFAAGDRPYLIMESIDGRDLRTLLDGGRSLPWESAAEVALQICAGLEQAHRAGVLHRNICPSNILMADTTPKLTGFGISAMADDTDPDGLIHRAPETFDEVWDERTDLYSVASVLYQMIDGNPPFWRPGDATPDAIRLRVTHEPAPTLDPDLVPAPLGVFVSAALSKDPLDRPQTADEFLHELELIRQGRTTGSNPSVLHGETGPMAVHPPYPPPYPPPAPSPPSTMGVEGQHGPGSTWWDPELTGPPAMGSVVSGDLVEPGQDQPLAWAPPIGGATTVYT
ncbi:MAG: serine/threonine-protein kinase, partial [Acidimicrobiales bacterium]